MKSLLKMNLRFILFASALLMFSAVSGSAQSAQVFRLDGGDSTYAFGVNERGELQPLYWGGRIGPTDSIPPAHSLSASEERGVTVFAQIRRGWPH